MFLQGHRYHQISSIFIPEFLCSPRYISPSTSSILCVDLFIFQATSEGERAVSITSRHKPQQLQDYDRYHRHDVIRRPSRVKHVHREMTTLGYR